MLCLVLNKFEIQYKQDIILVMSYYMEMKLSSVICKEEYINE